MDGSLNPRDVFGSHDDADHVYNTPRAWFMERYLNPNTYRWTVRLLILHRFPTICVVHGSRKKDHS